MRYIRVAFFLIMLVVLFGCQETKLELQFATEESGSLKIIAKYNEDELEAYGFLASTTTEFLPFLQDDSGKLIEQVYSGLTIVHEKEYALLGEITAKEYLITFDSIESLNTLLYDVGFELLHERRVNKSIYTLKRKMPEKIVQFSSVSGSQSLEQPYAEDSSFFLEMILLLYSKSIVEFELGSYRGSSYVNKGEIEDGYARRRVDLASVVDKNFVWTVHTQ